MFFEDVAFVQQPFHFIGEMLHRSCTKVNPRFLPLEFTSLCACCTSSLGPKVAWDEHKHTDV